MGNQYAFDPYSMNMGPVSNQNQSRIGGMMLDQNPEANGQPQNNFKMPSNLYQLPPNAQMRMDQPSQSMQMRDTTNMMPPPPRVQQTQNQHLQNP